MHSHNNGLKTALLLGSMVGFLLLIGAGLAYLTRSSIFILLFGLIGVGTVAYTYWNSDKLAIRSMNAYPVTREQIPGLYAIVEELSVKANQPMPKLYVAPTMTPNAFATGRNPQNAAVCCTEGILQLLDEREMRGVIGHELMHVYNRDILTGSIAAAIASVIGTIAQFATFGAMFGGNREENRGGGLVFTLLIAFLAPLASAVMQMAISRTREYDADEDGARLAGDPLALASALHKLENGVSRYPMNPENRQTAGAASMMIANPFRGGGSIKNLMATHPPMADRIARLENMARQNGQL
ncbi:MAG: zinc metalloprotease HtpX [Rothia sp. (in: high G+C Gram-positive bacteria)]|uniref:zinc metalloprotease HtpX n=1 Tax=Rothia sp. (in: high G+C Gram-positive bacteria) TaxID=1885016 RepID=UPI0027014D4E|nr:zinc metalloprotease HtpX [Rothia sp. (in: high G+C Gram-positive bacteria)]